MSESFECDVTPTSSSFTQEQMTRMENNRKRALDILQAKDSLAKM